jgi:hypothetical protein
MNKWKEKWDGPSVRTGFPATVGQPLPIAPVGKNLGCVVVDVFVDDAGEAHLRAELYVGAGQNATYTAKVLDGCWLVDLPEGYFTSKEAIRTAIAHGPGKPGPTPPW